MKTSIAKDNNWKTSNLQVFWGEIAPTDHLLQVYEDELIFLNTLEGFVGSGFLAGDSVIVIATKSHLKTLNTLLEQHGFDTKALMAKDLYIPVDAEEALSMFMINGWPDEVLFKNMVSKLIIRAKKHGKTIRAFGEMVALLWAKGNSAATINLEHLWNRFCEEEPFCLFCAYPKGGFTQDANDSIVHICNKHSKLVGGWQNASTEIFYKETSVAV